MSPFVRILCSTLVALVAFVAMGALTRMSAPWLSLPQIITFAALMSAFSFLAILVSPDFLAQSAPSAVAVHPHRRGAVAQRVSSQRVALPMPKPAGAVVSILWGVIKVEIPMTAAAMA